MSPDAAARTEEHREQAPLWARALVVFLLILPVGLSIHSARHKSWTWDEFNHFAAGHYLVYTRHFTPFTVSYVPPLASYVSSLGLLPFNLNADEFPTEFFDYRTGVATRIAFKSAHAPETVRRYARAPFSLLFIPLGAAVYFWSRSLWTWRGGLISLSLVALSPTLLAHSRFVGEDMLFATCAVSALAAGRALLRHGGWARLLLVGILMAFAMLARFTGVLLIPVAMIGLLLAFFPATNGWSTHSPRKILAGFLCLALIVGAVVWLAYLGELDRGVPYPVPEGRRFLLDTEPPDGMVGQLAYAMAKSDMRWPAVSYLVGFASQFHHQASGHWNYLLGELRTDSGWWYYFPVAILAKTPIPEMAFWLAGLIGWWRSRSLLPAREAVWLAAFPCILLPLTMTSNVNIGLRYLLPLYPLAAIAAGAAGQLLAHRVHWAFLLLGISALAGTTFRTHPHYLPYFNRLAGGPENGHRILVDSNLDWGQDVDALYATALENDWLPMRVQYFGPPEGMKRAPARIAPVVNPCVYEPGYFAISATNRVGAYMPGQAMCVGWLDGFTPIAIVNHTIWVYDLPAR